MHYSPEQRDRKLHAKLRNIIIISLILLVYICGIVYMLFFNTNDAAAKEQNQCPEGCIKYYDGCNTCDCPQAEGERMRCFRSKAECNSVNATPMRFLCPIIIVFMKFILLKLVVTGLRGFLYSLCGPKHDRSKQASKELTSNTRVIFPMCALIFSNLF